MLRTHDDWERLVGAVIKEQQIWELCHAHSRSPSELSEASSSDSSFREINTLSAYWQQFKGAVERLKVGNRVRKLVLVSDFFPTFDAEYANLNSLKLLGTGTLGNTYACDVSDGVKVVVKRINKSVSVSDEEFLRSMDFVGRINHENVVALRAYYCFENEKLVMYDYYSQGSVYQLLHGQTSDLVEWETRVRIAIGAARGLASIHEENGGKLVHGNIKSTNILLNQEYYGYIADLGMMNLTAANFKQNDHCHAPEVKTTKDVSQESDVYSFGILLFELLTRKPSVQVLGGPEAVDLVKLMKYVKSTKMTSKVLDPYLLQYQTISEKMSKVLQIGISCVVKSVKKRPKMFEVAKMLEDLDISRAPENDVLVNQNDALSDDPFDLEDPLRASIKLLGKGMSEVLDISNVRKNDVFVNENFVSSGDPFDLEDTLRASTKLLGKGNRIRTHENWERLVGAVLKKQLLWELCHAHSRSPSMLSEASSSNISSLSFRESNTSIEYQKQKLVLVSDFVPAFDIGDLNLNSLKLLGTGNCGNTYVGDASYGSKIVLKKINTSVSQEEFKRSIYVVASVRHENVVALRAYYCSDNEKLMIYDYYSQGSVYELLHGQTSETPNHVSWETRLRIAIGAARGLALIHAQNGGNLVHGNIKSTNVFLNHENYGSVSDFGTINLIAAKFRRNERCHAPEVKDTRNVSQESDVYSFGILLFELLTRKPSVQVLGGPKAVRLVKLMKSVKTIKMTSKVFDANLLQYQTVIEHMVRVLHIGKSCVVKSVKKRPKMSEVAKMLEDLEISLAQKMLRARENWERLVGAVLRRQQQHLKFSDPQFEVAQIVENFEYDDDCEIIGNGTFGTSYKVCLESGLVVRVKRLKDVNAPYKEFKRHMEIIGRIKHERCAKVMAYCFSNADEALLGYGHYNHGMLSDLLHGELDASSLAWYVRLRIALTIAQGITHIHGIDGSTLVHGNIKSSNIFVDRFNNATITDTALWKVTKPIQNSVLRHQGHFAPEVKDTRNVSQASDVYSFGVVLLELLTRRSSQVTSLVGLVKECVARDLASTVLDPELRGCDAMKELLQLAMDCVEDAPEQRPMMYVVVKRLKLIWAISHIYMPPMYSYFEDALEDQLSRLTI